MPLLCWACGVARSHKHGACCLQVSAALPRPLAEQYCSMDSADTQLACSATLRVLRPPEDVQQLKEGEVLCVSALTAPAGGKGAGLELQVR